MRAVIADDSLLMRQGVVHVLALMAEGRSNRGISQKLYLQPKTVEGHVHNIFRKLQITEAPDDHRRVLAVLTYLHA